METLTDVEEGPVSYRERNIKQARTIKRVQDYIRKLVCQSKVKRTVTECHCCVCGLKKMLGVVCGAN